VLVDAGATVDIKDKVCNLYIVIMLFDWYNYICVYICIYTYIDLKESISATKVRNSAATIYWYINICHDI